MLNRMINLIEEMYIIPYRHEFVKAIPNEINISKEYLRINYSTLK